MFAIFISFCICITGSGCSLRIDYDFLNDTSEILTIEIVVINEFVAYSEPLYETICLIEDEQEFLNDFSKIECNKRFSDPKEIYKNVPVIRIAYKNNEYEFINYIGQETSRNAYGNNVSLNEEQFISFIEKYVGMDYEDIVQETTVQIS